MSVELDICNSTIIKLGANPIESLDDDSKEARLCKMQYPKIRDLVLHTSPWPFAIKRVSLNPINVAMPFETGENIFQLPSDCVRVWKSNDPRYNSSYRLEAGRRVSSSVDVLLLFYVSNGVPVNDYSGSFKEALASWLASDLAYSLTQSLNLKNTYFNEAQTIVNLSRSTSSQEQTPENFDFDDFLNSRVGRYP